MPDIQPKKLRFTLICRGLDSETYVLNNAPVEWQKTGFENNRDDDTQGIVRKLTSPTTWVTDAAYLLRREYYNHGQLLADVKLVVDKFNTASNIWKYQTIFTGKFDFSGGSFTDNENNVTASIINDDLSVYIDANKDTDYAIPVDVPEAVTVNLTPIKLVEQPSLILVNENNPQANVFPAWNIAQYTQNAVYPSVFDVTRNKEDDPDFTTAGSVYFIAQTDTIVQHRVVFNCFLDYSSNAVYAIQIWSSKGYMVKQLYVYANGTNVGNTVVSFDIPFAVAVTKGENLKLYFDSSKKDDDRGFRIDGTTSASIELSYQTISDATQCKALPIAYIFKELTKRMNRGIAYPTQSVLLQSSLSNIYITCSDAIRKTEAGQVFQAGETLQIGGRYLVLGDTVRYNNILYPVNTYFTYKVGVDTFSSDSGDGFVRQVASSPAIITNWTDFLKSVRGWMGGQAGFGINNALAVLEDLGYFFAPTLIADLGSNPKWGGLSAAEEYGYNSIKVGYDDQQYTSTNGSQEVNSTQNYSTYALKPVKELDLTVPYRADSHGIEEIRVRPPDSASSKSDNDTIALWLVKGNDGIYQPDTVDSYNYSGVDAGYYNWQLTPKHNLLRGGAFLHAVFTSLEGYMLNFESGLKNTNFQINGVKESDSVLVSSLPKALFLPQTVTITVPGSDERQRAIDAMPYGYLQFTFKGNVYKGHILSANTNEYNNAQMDYKLLLTNDVNLSTLIR